MNGERPLSADRSVGMGGQLVREGYSGTGPGAITPDGCAVELYTRLAVGDEPDVIEAAAPPGRASSNWAAARAG